MKRKIILGIAVLVLLVCIVFVWIADTPTLPPDEFAVEIIELNIGFNGWDSQGRLFAAVDPNEIYWAENGNPHNLTLRYSFHNETVEIIGFFIDSENRIFVSTGWGYITMRSVDQGETFHRVFNAGCWNGGFGEDSEGNLYVGRWGDGGKVYRSSDGGLTWSEISASIWVNTDHCHSLAVDPETDWLYVTLGDVDGYDGVWRSKLKDGSDWVFKASLKVALPWGNNTEDSFQWVGIEFKDGYIYLGADSPPSGIYRFQDDGTPTKVEPEMVCKFDGIFSWSYYLHKDKDGRLWASEKPAVHWTNSTGGVLWSSDDGVTWIKRATTAPEEYSHWFYSTHTLREGTVVFRGNDILLSYPNRSALYGYWKQGGDS